MRKGATLGNHVAVLDIGETGITDEADILALADITIDAEG